MVLRRNVLIVHTGALGDFVLTWPLAMALGRLYPQSRIVYVTHASKGRLAERVMGVESADVEQGWHGLFSERGEIAAGVGRMLEGARSIYSFVTTGADPWAERVRGLAGEAELHALRPRPPADYSAHATRWLVEQLPEGSAIRPAVEQMLRSIGDRGVGGRRASGMDVVMHPGSGSVEKCWPVRCFAELARRLGDEGWRVRFVVGEVELERWSASQVGELESAGAVDRPGDYVELLEKLAGARLFVGNDSGPGHLAGVTGVPTVSLFGSTDARVWRPMGPAVEVVQARLLVELEVGRVYEAAVRLLSSEAR